MPLKISPEFANDNPGLQSIAHASQIFNPLEENIIKTEYVSHYFERLSSVEEFKKWYNFLKFNAICNH